MINLILLKDHNLYNIKRLRSLIENFSLQCFALKIFFSEYKLNSKSLPIKNIMTKMKTKKYQSMIQVYKMEKNCAICNRLDKEFNLCGIHLKAYKNLNESYKDWLKALNNELSMNGYLKKILNLQDTGNAIREVATYLLENDMSSNQNG